MSPEQFARLPEREQAAELARVADVGIDSALAFLRGDRPRPRKVERDGRAQRVDARRALLAARMGPALERLRTPRVVVHVGGAESGHFGCVIEVAGDRVPFVFWKLRAEFSDARGQRR